MSELTAEATLHQRIIRNRGDMLPGLTSIRSLATEKSTGVSACLYQKAVVSVKLQRVGLDSPRATETILLRSPRQ